MTTATTTLGSAAGAIPTNQLSSLPSPRSWVPVLPATATSSKAALPPVPSVTTPFMMSISAAAVSASMACFSFTGMGEKLRSPLAL